MNVAVIGTGYVGLVAGACFADAGHRVWCVDSDEGKISRLKQGHIPIYEPGLEEIVKKGAAEERLFFTTQTAEAVDKAEVIFLAVGTPSLPSGEPNLSYLKSAAEAIGRAMRGPKIVVNKSTVPVGTFLLVKNWISALTPHAVEVVSNPEFLKEGHALEDFMRPDRVIVGTSSDRAFEKISELYAPFVRQGNPVIRMEPVGAEVTKYACNAFLATRISFMNELSGLCEKVGADIEDIRKGMATDPRIGRHFLYAGAGFGGSCFPKDIRALVTTAERNQVRLGIVAESLNSNERQKRRMFEKVVTELGADLRGRTIALWGLAFKPNTDDVREAPALTVVKLLLQAGARVQAYDPVARETFRQEMGDSIQYCHSSKEALKDADALLILTEWNEFKNPNWPTLREEMKGRVVIDGRNILNHVQAVDAGFRYVGVGRLVHHPESTHQPIASVLERPDASAFLNPV